MRLPNARSKPWILGAQLTRAASGGQTQRNIPLYAIITIHLCMHFTRVCVSAKKDCATKAVTHIHASTQLDSASQATPRLSHRARTHPFTRHRPYESSRQLFV